ncbi:hypothetical protein NP493_2g12005 [Ridgeia piscesae]|uniref:Uncharacterized protein n=1 Tax=Ridgeia piscesae TaxID=27915 RepID=A0AAD9ULT9_RIDPI|nr:hypothetical protein NP493_2g12005 [Ridgeia piscesae]
MTNPGWVMYAPSRVSSVVTLLPFCTTTAGGSEDVTDLWVAVTCDSSYVSSSSILRSDLSFLMIVPSGFNVTRSTVVVLVTTTRPLAPASPAGDIRVRSTCSLVIMSRESSIGCVTGRGVVELTDVSRDRVDVSRCFVSNWIGMSAMRMPERTASATGICVFVDEQKNRLFSESTRPIFSASVNFTGPSGSGTATPLVVSRGFCGDRSRLVRSNVSADVTYVVSVSTVNSTPLDGTSIGAVPLSNTRRPLFSASFSEIV